MAPSAVTRSGPVVGTDATDHIVFKGIPFAAPPTGALRWQPPQREATWSEPLDATTFGPQSVQTEMMLEQLMGAGDSERSEDCLTLNVWTPSLDGSRPVMVWIHGGAFQFGSGSTAWYDGERFTTNGDVVVVTVNYRLGPLGFMYLGDLFGAEYAESGNLGLLDQIAALEWVHENIAAFGGDPGQVTIFGESAGGASVATLMGTPAARPGELFQRVIAQSGAVSWGLSREQATANARRILDALELAHDDLDGLLAADATALCTAAAVLGVETGGASLPFAPVHDDVVLPEHPLEAIRKGSARGVALLTGTNLDEMTLFNLIDPALATIDEAGLTERVAQRYGSDAHELVNAYRGLRPDTSIGDLWTVMSSDVVFRIPALLLVDAHLEHGPVHVYLFSWPSPVFGGALKACHAIEIPFVFDNLHQPGVPMFVGEGAELPELAQRTHQAWIGFARAGDPQHSGIPEWPRYDLERRPTMQIDVEWELVHDPYGDERKLWDGWEH